MKVCCELGKYAHLMSATELLGCNHDHCKGMIELATYSQEIGMYPTIDKHSELLISNMNFTHGEEE